MRKIDARSEHGFVKGFLCGPCCNVKGDVVGFDVPSLGFVEEFLPNPKHFVGKMFDVDADAAAAYCHRHIATGVADAYVQRAVGNVWSAGGCVADWRNAAVERMQQQMFGEQFDASLGKLCVENRFGVDAAALAQIEQHVLVLVDLPDG